MSLFRLDSSIRQQDSVSRKVADTFEQAWVAHHPVGTVTRRDLAADPLPADAWTVAVSGRFLPDAEKTPAQLAAQALAATLADELIGVDAAVIAAPLYNFGISQHLKAWIDLIMTDGRFGPGQQPLTGRPVTLVVARGGGYGPGTPREGWDHATPYLERIFGDAMGADVTVLAVELTLADVAPTMAELRPLAATLREKAHEVAAETGRTQAELVSAVA